MKRFSESISPELIRFFVMFASYTPFVVGISVCLKNPFRAFFIAFLFLFLPNISASNLTLFAQIDHSFSEEETDEFSLDIPEEISSDVPKRLQDKKMEDFPEIETEIETEIESEIESEIETEVETKTDAETETDFENDTLTVPDDFSLDVPENLEEKEEKTEKIGVQKKREPEPTQAKAKAKTKTKPQMKTIKPVVKATIPPYTDEELALRTKIHNTLRKYDHISLCTQENRPIDVISYIVPYGCDAEIYYGPREGNTRINAIGALCWNVPLGNESAFSDSTKRLMPRLGYGIQQYSGQLLAALAIARVPIDYRFPAGWATETEKNGIEEETETENETLNEPDANSVLPRGKKRFGIQNLVEFEQQNCQWGRDLSQTLIGLAYYLPQDAEWESSNGEHWTLERLVQNELERPISVDNSSATNQLLGLLCAIRCRQMRTKNAPLTGQYARADSYMKRFHTYILDIQNEINVWHPEFFKKKGMTPEKPTEMLIASGHILRWLVTATPREQLNDSRILKSVITVQELLDYQLTYWDPTNAPGTEIEGIMTALHALTIYEKRRFK